MARDLAPDYAIVVSPPACALSTRKGAHRGRVTFTGVPKARLLATTA